MSRSTGRTNLLLQAYFELKLKLCELKVRQRFRNNDELIKNIEETEKRTVENISMHDKEQLRQIILMSLDIDHEEQEIVR